MNVPASHPSIYSLDLIPVNQMPHTLKGVRLIVLAAEDLEIPLRKSIEVLEAAGHFANSPAELSSLIHNDTVYQVAILPAKPMAASWLSICHDISALKPPPAILVYSDQFSYELWTQVLDEEDSTSLSSH